MVVFCQTKLASGHPVESSSSSNTAEMTNIVTIIFSC